jgi:hypothetical protein
MAEKLIAWDRLVRYIPVGDRDKIAYGEPILQDDEANEIANLAAAGKLRVRVLHGSDPLSARPTGEEAIVWKLLGPLEPKDVRIVRCIGLNYKTHSTGPPLSKETNTSQVVNQNRQLTRDCE